MKALVVEALFYVQAWLQECCAAAQISRRMFAVGSGGTSVGPPGPSAPCVGPLVTLVTAVAGDPEHLDFHFTREK